MIIRAELIGSEICTAEGITIEGHAPVLSLCRKLIDAGYDPTARSECYRGETLCLTVASIGKGAELISGKPRAFHGRQSISPPSGTVGKVRGLVVQREIFPRGRVTKGRTEKRKTVTDIRCPHCGRIAAWVSYQEPKAGSVLQPTEADFDRLIADYPWPKNIRTRISISVSLKASGLFATCAGCRTGITWLRCLAGVDSGTNRARSLNAHWRVSGCGLECCQ